MRCAAFGSIQSVEWKRRSRAERSYALPRAGGGSGGGSSNRLVARHPHLPKHADMTPSVGYVKHMMSHSKGEPGAARRQPAGLSDGSRLARKPETFANPRWCHHHIALQTVRHGHIAVTSNLLLSIAEEVSHWWHPYSSTAGTLPPNHLRSPLPPRLKAQTGANATC